jgi:hypothetical protein
VLQEEYEHLHNHYLWIQGQLGAVLDRLDGMDAALRGIAQIEIFTSLEEMSSMAKQSEEIGKLSGKFDDLSGVVTDIHADFEAFRTAMEAERDTLSPEGQVALDDANTKADSLRQRLSDLDVEVGDADGSDTAAGGGTDVNTENPPAGEGTVVAPDVPVEGNAQPTV